MSHNPYRPLVGVTMWADMPQDKQFIRNSYLEALLLEGAQPLCFPMMNDDADIERFLSLVDGVVFSGGPDIDSTIYGEERRTAFEPVPPRDYFEMKLMRLALDRGVPVFAICRGLQVMNVLQGGKLHQHIPDDIDTDIDHAILGDDGNGTQKIHEVYVSGTSRLYEIVRRSVLPVNSYHHQAIKELGHDLDITGYSEDGIIEGIEFKGTGYNIAVQWHPELFYRTGDESSKRLFAAFVEAARSYRMEHGQVSNVG